jgi:hypothetical protein
VELQAATSIQDHLATRLQFAFSSQSEAASGFGEAWLRYNSGASGSYWTALLGQIPVLDGFKLGAGGNRDITLTPALALDVNGPLTDVGQGNFALGGLERGIEVGYNWNKFNGRVSWLNGVNEAGEGDVSLGGQGRRLHDVALQGEYLIGNDGTSLGAFYYHGQTPLHDSSAGGNGFNNGFYRAGALASYSRVLKPWQRGIPDTSLDLNLAYIIGDDQIDLAGDRAKSRGGIVEVDAYHRNRTALVLRYDSARPSDAAGTPTTEAYTAAVADRPSDYFRWELEYRTQRWPGANSAIASLWFFY